MDQKLLYYLILMTVSIGTHMKLLENGFQGYFRKEIPCELIGICTLNYVNKNLSDEESFHFCGSG